MKLQNIFSRRSMACLVAAGSTLCAIAQNSNSQSTASAEDIAWREVQAAFAPPPPPSEWKGKQPTKQQSEAYLAEQGRLAGIAADKAKAFLAAHPTHAKVEEARKGYLRMLQKSVGLGNTNRAVELNQVLSDRIKDPNTPEEERFGLRSQQLSRELQSTLKEGDDQLAAIEKLARQLMREFPKRSEPYEYLLNVAGNTDDAAHAAAIVKEVSAADVSPEVKSQAKAIASRAERVGRPLEIKFKATNGEEVDVQSFKGKVVLVDFWATWCGPCVKEIPNVRTTYEKLHPDGFEIVGISFDSDRKKLDDFVEKEKMPWVQYFDGKRWGNEIGKQFAINSIPAMWLVDKKGVLRDLNGRADLEKKVTKLLAE